MKALVAVAVMLIIGIGSSLAGEVPTLTNESEGVISTGALDCVQLRATGASGTELAQQGCCSWHGGVCGCQSGRKVCCDGSYSPSCTCAVDGPVQEPFFKPQS